MCVEMCLDVALQEVVDLKAQLSALRVQLADEKTNSDATSVSQSAAKHKSALQNNM